MLTIENRMNLKDYIVKVGQILYVVEGVYEYPNTYDIHLRSSKSNPNHKNIPDELLCLIRTPKKAELKGVIHKYYDLIDSRKPHNKAGLIKEALQNIDSVLNVIKHILSKTK